MIFFSIFNKSSFILTMRNVNVDVPATISKLRTSFILTMRNVNLVYPLSKLDKFSGFILTMRNVNGEISPEQYKEIRFYLNYEECKLYQDLI